MLNPAGFELTAIWLGEAAFAEGSVTGMPVGAGVGFDGDVVEVDPVTGAALELPPPPPPPHAARPNAPSASVRKRRPFGPHKEKMEQSLQRTCKQATR
jgi:hypothetical protein